MANYTLSPNMNLPIPTIGTDPGPDWASNLNSSLTLIDQHNHTSGEGVQINPAGLNINSDLTFLNNNAIALRSARFQAQSSVLTGANDLGCLYVDGLDLYFNDVSGNHVRITQSGGVAGSPGSISNLTSPATASYVSANSTFVWQSAANTPANLDAGSVILRNITANSKGLTLNPPSAMAADYALTLPTLPASQKFMTLDNSGNISAPYTVDNSSLIISSNIIKVGALGIQTSMLANNSVTNAKLSANNYSLSASSGTFSTTSNTFVNVTNLSSVITTSGRCVYISLIDDGSGNGGIIEANGGELLWSFYRNGVQLAPSLIGISATSVLYPPGMFIFIDFIAAGTYTYTMKVATSGTNASVFFVKLLAMEM